MQVPAATRALSVLREIASHSSPIEAAIISRNLQLPRSSTYHLLKAMQEQGFVTYFPEDKSWGLGVSVFEIGSAYLRHEPLERLARPVLAKFVKSKRMAIVAHLGILHGAETMYLLKETSPKPLTLITDVGVRLPAPLTATGRAILAQMPLPQVRAIFPNSKSFISRTGIGPKSPNELFDVLKKEKRDGYSTEVGLITAGYRSIAMSVFDRSNHPVAAIGLTIQVSDFAPTELVPELSRMAKELTRRLN